MIKALFLLHLFLLPGFLYGSSILDHKGFTHLAFEGIKETIFERTPGLWVLKVDASSSAMVLAFDKVRSVGGISFEWLSNGQLKMDSAAMEKTKKGDDAKIRVGLILSGESSPIPFFAPSWVKALSGILKQDTNGLFYLTPGMMTKKGATFESPYSDSIKTMSVPSKMLDHKWQQVTERFEKKKQVVGLWIMADGDNTGSSFTTKLRHLRLLP